MLSQTRDISVICPTFSQLWKREQHEITEGVTSCLCCTRVSRVTALSLHSGQKVALWEVNGKLYTCRTKYYLKTLLGYGNNKSEVERSCMLLALHLSKWLVYIVGLTVCLYSSMCVCMCVCCVCMCVHACAYVCACVQQAVRGLIC